MDREETMHLDTTEKSKPYAENFFERLSSEELNLFMQEKEREFKREQLRYKCGDIFFAALGTLALMCMLLLLVILCKEFI